MAAGEEPIDEEAILSDSEEGPDALRVTITPVAARAFVARARRVVAAGRPAVPAVLAAAGPQRARLPAAERLPPLSGRPMSEHPAQPAAGPELRPPLDDAEARALLREGEIDLEGRLLDASNVTLVGTIRTGDAGRRVRLQAGRGGAAAVGLPRRHAGRPGDLRLPGLRGHRAGGSCRRPCCARARSAPAWCSCGWTATSTSTWPRSCAATTPALRRMAVFDAVVNNADRKGGHIIPMPDGHVYGVDHGICFSVDPKLRTLLWRWAGKPLPDDAVEVLERLADELRGDLGEQLHEHLTRSEVRCTQQRVAELLRTGRHPEPSGEWPALPWPPF